MSLFTVLLLVESLHFIFARVLLPYLPPTTSALYVLGVGAVEIGLFAALRGRLRWRPGLTHFWFFLAIGVLIGGSTMLSYSSVEFVDAGTASMLGKTGIVISLLLGVFWLKERLSRRQVLGALLAVLGTFVVSYHPGNVVQFGSLLVLASTLMYALHTALVKRYGQHMDFLDFFFHRLLFTTLSLVGMAALRGDLIWPDWSVWPLLVLVGTVDVVISRWLYYVTLRMFSMSIHTVILTLSPVASIIIALFLFGTFPGAQELAGGVAILAGVVVVTRSR